MQWTESVSKPCRISARDYEFRRNYEIRRCHRIHSAPAPNDLTNDVSDNRTLVLTVLYKHCDILLKNRYHRRKLVKSYAHKMEPIPTTMRALAARNYSKPDCYELIQVPVPTIKAPDEVLIQMYAVGLFTGDTQTAAGSFRFITKTRCTNSSRTCIGKY